MSGARTHWPGWRAHAIRPRGQQGREAGGARPWKMLDVGLRGVALILKTSEDQESNSQWRRFYISPRWFTGKESACNAEDARDAG